MADEWKGVTVDLPGTLGDRRYKDATIIDIHDEGHLYIYDASNNVVAIHAPSRWQNAVVSR